ncbi:MAG TPA: BatD family protein, partial [Planctomycetota bacterium]|nr:BatD family protein [Planctomycetota bacterium]
MIALACLIAGLCLQAPQSERLRVTGPQPPVVVFPEASQIGLRIELDDAAQAQRLGRPRLPEVDGLQMSLSGPSTSQHSIFDGRRLIESVSVSWTVRIVPLRVGEFTIPSFDVPVGRGVERTPPLTLRVVRDVSGEEFGFLQVDVRPRRAYVHEPVRVRFELGVDRDLQIAEGQANNGERYLSIEIAAPWLGNLEGTVPIEPERVEPGRLINLVHSDGRTRSLLRAQRTGEVRRDGRPFDAFTLERSFLPSRPGKLSIPETAMGFSVFTGETRVVQDFVFARREPVVKTHYVSAPAVEVEVLPLPEEARPSPFYGAVGRFTISSRVDRERVRVGSSVKLTVSIRGEGNTEFLQVPELPRELDGLHLLGSTERRERGLVEATYDLTPLHADVRRTPEVRWNFFDTTPGVERYVEVVAPSVPITVEALPEGEGLKPLPGEEAKAVVPGVDDIFDMKELDAGEPAPALPPPRPEVAAGILLAPWIIALGLALFLRRHARVRADVAGRRERRAGKAFARALAAGKSPADALVAYLADRLAVSDAAIIAPDLAERLTARGVDPALAARVEAAVEAGVAARY